MFDQDKFANILKKINSTYATMTDFGKNASFDRTYISKYINKKLSNPPTPKILEKIAKASHGITNYNELMHICGYLSVYNSDNIDIFAENNNQEKPYLFLNIKDNYNDLSKEENFSLQEIFEIFKERLMNNQEINWEIIQSNKDLSYHKLSNKENLKKAIQSILDTIQAIKISTERIKENKLNALGNLVVSIPVLGVVKAGYDYLAEENVIDTIDIEKRIVGDGTDFFALKVKGDSMQPVLYENDVVIIKKQDNCEDGQIAVVLINGDEATIKRVKKSSNGIWLQPFNNNYEPLVFTNDEIENIPVKIIGVVKQLQREF